MKLILSFISVFTLFYFTPEEVIQLSGGTLLGKSDIQAKHTENKSSLGIKEFPEHYTAEQGSKPENLPLEPIETYTNEEGHQIQSPTRYEFAPEGASALCRDGTYSFSENRRGTCSHHGGVAKWLR
jgi:Protein of unknown function (DUF3761)